MNLTEHCVQTYHRGVSATPVVVEDVAYFPTWSGSFVALNYAQCRVIWEFDVIGYVDSHYTQDKMQKKIVFQTSRTSPALDADVLYIGTQPQALLIALDRFTGKPIHHVQVNPHPYAIITQSPTFHDGMVFVGAASREEAAALGVPGFKCCSFVGNMVAAKLDREAGKLRVLWNVTMLPSNSGWAGAAIWGSQPSVDAQRGQVFIGTGNVYTAPNQFLQCRQQTKNITVIAEGLTADPCLPRNVLQESVLALDMRTGVINWAQQLSPLDAWTAACGFGGSIFNPNATRIPSRCPYKPGPDADFGMAPTFVPGSQNTPYGKDILVVGQKNGNLYALSAQAGMLLWATNTSPDGNVGGLIWGIAVDDYSIYYTAVNSDLKTWQIQPSNETTKSSAFGSASLINGSILWETPVPNDAFAIAPPTVVNDVVLFTRAGKQSAPIREQYTKTVGGLIPVNKHTGKILDEYELDATMHGGIAVVDRYVLFGTGYEPPYNGSGSFYVYCAGSQ